MNKPTITAWTDGACSGNPGPGGWAWVAISEKAEYKNSGHKSETTNNMMELQAVLDLVKFPLFAHCHIIVHTDSQGVISWLTGKWKRNNPGVIDACKKIESYVRDNKITLSFVKVKAHSGDEMNERVDQMAVLESQNR